MRYQLTAIFTRPWLPNGLSLRLIESHYENHYGGALRRLNAITAQLESMDFERTPAHVVKGLKREQLIALNSTLLHELCFASMAFGAAAGAEGVRRRARGRRGGGEGHARRRSGDPGHRCRPDQAARPRVTRTP
jgi:hypothetical protein